MRPEVIKIIIIVIAVVLLLVGLIGFGVKKYNSQSQSAMEIPAELKARAAEFIDLYQQKKALGQNTEEIESIVDQIRKARKNGDVKKLYGLLDQGISILKGMEAICGDKICSLGESCSTCQTDCGVCKQSEFCGDNICNNQESCLTCSQDCGACTSELLFEDGFESGKMSTGWSGFLVNIEKGKPMSLPNLPIDELGTYILDKTDAMKIVTSPVKSGKYAIQMTVEPGDGHNNADLLIKKERSELKRFGFGNEATLGAEQWYAVSILIPEDDNYVHPGGSSFNTVTQWLHSEITREEKIAKLGSPSISLSYHPAATKKMSLSYGVGKAGKDIFSVPMQKGVWMDWIFHIKWSTKSDGFLAAWKDGKPVTPFNGEDYKVYRANMLNEEPYSYKIGIYRGHDVQTTNSIYYDDIKISSEPLI